MLWIAGGLAEGDRRVLLWAAAVVIDYVVTWFGFPIPGLGRSRTPEWMIAGAHLAERHELFIILALGESILVTGATYGELPRSMATVMAFVVAFIGSVALWWLYFDRGAEAGREAITHTVDPGWLGALRLLLLPPADGGGHHHGRRRRRADDRPPHGAGNTRDDGLDPGRTGALPRRQRTVHLGALGSGALVAAGRDRRPDRAHAAGRRRVSAHPLTAATLVLVALVGWDLRGGR